MLVFNNFCKSPYPNSFVIPFHMCPMHLLSLAHLIPVLLYFPKDCHVHGTYKPIRIAAKGELIWCLLEEEDKAFRFVWDKSIYNLESGARNDEKKME